MICTPAISEESIYGTREIAIRTKQLTEGKVFLTGIISEDSANEVISQMM